MELPEDESLKTNSGSIKSLRRLRWTRVPRSFYLGQITYGSGPISKRPVDNPSQTNPDLATAETFSNWAQFSSIYIGSSYIHMIQTSEMLKSNVDNKRDAKSNTFKQAMYCSDWPK